MLINAFPTAFAAMDEWITEEITTSETWTVPDGVTEIFVQVFGGGGAGTYDASDFYRGGGGGSGHMNTAYLKVTPGQKFAVTIGAGGVSSSKWWNANPGGTTSFGSEVLANGGEGGRAENGGNGGAGGGSTGLNTHTGGNGSYGGGGGGNKGGYGGQFGGDGSRSDAGGSTTRFGGTAGKDGTNYWIVSGVDCNASYDGRAGDGIKNGGGGFGGRGGINLGGGGGVCANGGNGDNSDPDSSSSGDGGGGGGGWMGGHGGDALSGGGGGGGGYGSTKLSGDGMNDDSEVISRGGLGYGAGGGGGKGGKGAPGICIIKYRKVV